MEQRPRRAALGRDQDRVESVRLGPEQLGHGPAGLEEAGLRKQLADLLLVVGDLAGAGDAQRPPTPKLVPTLELRPAIVEDHEGESLVEIGRREHERPRALGRDRDARHGEIAFALLEVLREPGPGERHEAPGPRPARSASSWAISTSRPTRSPRAFSKAKGSESSRYPTLSLPRA